MIKLTLALAILLSCCAFSTAVAADGPCYEMRTYYAGPGKLEALHARFRDHTCKLFEKHGIVNVGYWVPIENTDNKLIYVLAYPSREAREASWKAFMADPDWQAAYKASTAAGRLVQKVENVFLSATDYSPEIKASLESPECVFELRTYTTTPGNLPALNARFRDHTVALFKKYGMTNFAYWNPMPDQKEAGNTLIYILAHKSREAARESFGGFRDDPAWIAARKASEDKAGCSLTAPGGVKSVFMSPTDYSQTK